jgi:hypothetical protein
MDPMLIAPLFAGIVTNLLREDIVDPFLQNIGATSSVPFLTSVTP